MIDDENLHRACLRFQCEPKLFLNRREERRLALTWRPVQCEIVLVCEPGLIQNGAMQVMLRQVLHQGRDRNSLSEELARFRPVSPSYGDAVRAFESVGVSVARYRPLNLQAVPCNDQRIYWNFFGVVVDRQLEAIRQKRLKHAPRLKETLIWAKLLQLGNYRFVDFRINIVSFRVEPVRPS